MLPDGALAGLEPKKGSFSLFCGGSGECFKEIKHTQKEVLHLLVFFTLVVNGFCVVVCFSIFLSIKRQNRTAFSHFQFETGIENDVILILE